MKPREIAQAAVIGLVLALPFIVEIIKEIIK
jgi:hypothetical protein